MRGCPNGVFRPWVRWDGGWTWLENSSSAAQWGMGVGQNREKLAFPRLAFFSPLGLRTEIWMRYYRQITQNCGARLCGFAQNQEKVEILLRNSSKFRWGRRGLVKSQNLTPCFFDFWGFGGFRSVRIDPSRQVSMDESCG